MVNVAPTQATEREMASPTAREPRTLRRQLARAGRTRLLAVAVPPYLWYAILFIVPMVIVVAYSFGTNNAITASNPVDLGRLTVSNYGDVFTSTFRQVFRRTLVLSGVGTGLCLIIGYPVAYLISTRRSSIAKAALLLLVLLPFWTSYLLRMIGWSILLSARGPIGSVFIAAGLSPGGLNVLDTRFAVQIGLVYNYLPLMIIPLYVALDRVVPMLREASSDLGGSGLQTLCRITVPLSRPGIIAGIVLVFIPMTGDYITPTLLGGAQGEMAGNLVASQFFSAQNWALGSATAVLLVGLIVVVLGLVGGLFAGGEALWTSARNRSLRRAWEVV